MATISNIHRNTAMAIGNGDDLVARDAGRRVAPGRDQRWFASDPDRSNGAWGFPDFRSYLAGVFPGARIRKLCLHGGFSCPNLDGTVARGGCSYCNNQGFAPGLSGPEDLQRQWDRGRRALRRRHRRVDGFIAYFQSFSGTHAPVPHLRRIYQTVTNLAECVGISIGTRPDCLGPDVLRYLAELAEGWRFFCLEIGLQSDRDAVLRKLNRGHDLACFLDAVERSHDRGLPICAHVILGLPGEGADAPERMGRLLAGLPITFVKIHNFHIMRGTPLARLHTRLPTPSAQAYADACARLIAELRSDQYLQRVVADAPDHLLLSGGWCHDKQGFLRALRDRVTAARRSAPHTAR